MEVQEMENNKTTAIILAAGQGKRMENAVQKQYLLLGDKPVLYYSLKIFQESLVDNIILVTGKGECNYVRQNIVEKYGFHKVIRIVEGGTERYHSVYNGLIAVPEREGYCFIHDGARPFVTNEIIERAYECVIQEQACVVAMPVKDTIKLADREGYAQTTPDRNLIWMMQTPQVFEYGLITDAYCKLTDQEAELRSQGISITDDACVIELFTDKKVKLVKGSYQNIKITTPEDLKIAEAFL